MRKEAGTALQQTSKSDFSQGSLSGNILRLALPMILALLVNTLYSIVDRIYIGHMAEGGKLALTGIGIRRPWACWRPP